MNPTTPPASTMSVEEAAKEYFDLPVELPPTKTISTRIRESFMAGAEWQASQPAAHSVQEGERLQSAQGTYMNGWVYEDGLPDLTAEEYSAWHQLSKVIEGVRMGPNPDKIDWGKAMEALPPTPAPAPVGEGGQPRMLRDEVLDLFNEEPDGVQDFQSYYAGFKKAINADPQLPNEDKGIYIASKTKHADKWRALREQGVNINSTWIDESDKNQSRDLADLCRRCIQESQDCYSMIVYAEEGDVLKGAFIEMGAAFTNPEKPVAFVGPVLPEGNAFTNAPNVRQFQTIEKALEWVQFMEPVKEATPSAKAEATEGQGELKCVAGCLRFTGGEIKHHEHCPYYPDSLSRRLDEAEAKLAATPAQEVADKGEAAQGFTLDQVRNLLNSALLPWVLGTDNRKKEVDKHLATLTPSQPAQTVDTTKNRIVDMGSYYPKGTAPAPQEAEREAPTQYVFIKPYVDPWFENAPVIEIGSILSRNQNGEWIAVSPKSREYEAIFHKLDTLLDKGYITLYKQSTQKP